MSTATLPSLAPPKLHRKVIRIRGEDSPNVRLALTQKSKGLPVTHEQIVPGVLSYAAYLERRATWDKIRQCIGIDGEFYEGAAVLLYPPTWLNLAETKAAQMRGQHQVARALGIDPAEGGDDSSFCVTGNDGIIYLESIKTPDPTVIPNRAISLMKEYGIEPENVMLDRGGGGGIHVAALRKLGYDVRSVSFGEPVQPDMTLYGKHWEEKVAERDARFTYKNRRAQMFHLVRLRLQPAITDKGVEYSTFGIPAEYTELRYQMAPIPLTYDEEGRIWLLPKHKRDKNDTRETLEELIGRSCDDADALALAVYAMEEGSEGLSATGGWA